jgi:hypothetical protein
MNHKDLFRSYVDDLSEASSLAGVWWDTLVKKETTRWSDEEQAMKQLERRWPFGPAAHPFVIRVFREYYLACHQLNVHNLLAAEGNPQESIDWEDESLWGEDIERDDEIEFVEPRDFVTDWLAGDHEELYTFVSHLVFCPVTDRD